MGGTAKQADERPERHSAKNPKIQSFGGHDKKEGFGKGNWGRLGEEESGRATDPNDPMYDDPMYDDSESELWKEEEPAAVPPATGSVAAQTAVNETN